MSGSNQITRAWAVPLAWTLQPKAIEALCKKTQVEDTDVDSFLSNLFTGKGISEGDELILLVDSDVRAFGVLTSVKAEKYQWDQIAVNFPSRLRVNPTSEVKELNPSERAEIWKQLPPCKPQSIILYGPPGTGKTYSTVKRAMELILGSERIASLTEEQLMALFRKYQAKGQIEFVTFHQAYGYEEFVEGIRPVLNKNTDDQVHYEIHAGVFKRIALRAASEGLFTDKTEEVHQALSKEDETAPFLFSVLSPQYVLIIDEINRGNMSKIFGELITLLEPDKRLTARNELKLPLSYSPHHRFAVPPNLHILGTMNTADRSIALMDVALRRRFIFEELMPNADVIRTALEKKAVNKVFIEFVVNIFEALNNRIRFLFDRDHQLGHSYFLESTNVENLRQVFKDCIIPMLQEYFYGDWDKICIVLGCPYTESGEAKRRDLQSLLDLHSKPKTYAHPIITANTFSEVETLGFDHDDYENRIDYCIHRDFHQGQLSEENLYKTFLGIIATNDKDFNQQLAELLAAKGV